jgi:hypothetical protein
MAVGTRHADHVATSIRKKLAITSPKRGGGSVDKVRSRTQTMEFIFFFKFITMLLHWRSFITSLLVQKINVSKITSLSDLNYSPTVWLNGLRNCNQKCQSETQVIWPRFQWCSCQLQIHRLINAKTLSLYWSFAVVFSINICTKFGFNFKEASCKVQPLLCQWEFRILEPFCFMEKHLDSRVNKNVERCPYAKRDIVSLKLTRELKHL